MPGVHPRHLLRTLRTALAARTREAVQASLEAFNRIHLPNAAVLPVAGAVVGLYSGLAAGLFANLIGLVSGVVLTPARLLEVLRPGSRTAKTLWEAFAEADWHPEYAIIGVPVAGAALALARLIKPGGARDEVKRRMRVLALLVLGALGLYYPLVALTALNVVFALTHALAELVPMLPWWTVLLAPPLGGLVVGHILRNHPETHGHGVPEVVMAVKREERGLPARRGLLKLIASAVTIGTGGSAGREGPIVYGGAAFASGVGRTLGFTRKELSVLLACGAGAGISASFNAPIAGAMFAMEIILREFELRVFSPIILASVTATLVGRGVLGPHAVLQRTTYRLVNGFEVLNYVVLGLLCGLLAFAFARLLHQLERIFHGHARGRVSAWLGRQTLGTRAAIGGVGVALMVFAHPAVWGSGTDFVNLATAGKLGLGALLVGCVLKLVATALTIGSGGSGGTFFPSMLIGALAGGAFGTLVHELLPFTTAPSGAYAMVGTAGVVAGFTRGPLTGLMMLYELSGNYAIILPLMVTCTISSALCHSLVERRAPRRLSDEELLATMPVSTLMVPVSPLPPDIRVRPLVDMLLAAEDGVLPVQDCQGRVVGIVQLEHLREVWREATARPELMATDVARRVPVLSAVEDLGSALRKMNLEDVDALPVLDTRGPEPVHGLLTRAAIRRRLFAEHTRLHDEGREPVAPTEVSQ
ncbi:MAG: chloride channel protein [Myxococcaceae bacterium]|nr:chloride channel protein [Myxococcaceae bacterium]